MSTAEGRAELQAGSIDRTLVERVLAGDDTAFVWLYQRHAKRIFNFCYRTICDRDLAAEATHQAFATLVHRLPEIELSRLSLETSLFASARATSLRAVARADATGAMGALRPESPAAFADPERAAATADHQLLIRSAAARLTPRHRKLLALRDGARMSYEEVSQVVSQPVTATARAITRARLRLHEELGVTVPPHFAVGSECVEALPLIAQRVDGEIAPGDDRRLREHLSTCEGCVYNLRAATEARTAYRRWLDLKPPGHLARRVIATEATAAPRREALAGLRFSAVRRLAAAGLGGASIALIATTFWLTPSNQGGGPELVAAQPVAQSFAADQTPALADAHRAAVAATAGAGGASAPGRPGIPAAYATRGPTAGAREQAPSRRVARRPGSRQYSGGLGVGGRKGKKRKGGGAPQKGPTPALLPALRPEKLPRPPLPVEIDPGTGASPGPPPGGTEEGAPGTRPPAKGGSPPGGDPDADR